MSKRIDVTGKSGATLSAKGSGLIYTKELGWLDLGHARGTDIRLLLNQFRSGEAGTKEYYRVSYRQQMSYRGTLFNTGRYVEWEVKKGRTRREIDSIALAMMMHTASLFEHWQTRFSWVTDSGFSAEDLVSDLLGFYSVVRPTNYLDLLTIDPKEKALRRWDFYGSVGQNKNKSFLPLLFPDPNDPCIRHTPYYGKLPHWMKQIGPFTDTGSKIARPLIKNGVSFGFLAG
ncbi:MAG: hypothetical protein E6Z83_15070 [Pantoea sp.]|uniref:hypothetical protein n=1 Tax=Pantoea sp. TaxID=69393 RepID=UPI00290E4FF4|nr:hypothetical protein [Pantoea sp.]MDU5782106.1 hypothetical protein [Pantoea sp.]